MTSSEFSAEIFEVCASSSVIVSVFIADAGSTWIRMRASLTDASFIEAFFNETRNKTAYAWVKERQRILGADNTWGWHWHPFTSPSAHISVEQPITFAEFLRKVEKHLTPIEEL